MVRRAGGSGALHLIPSSIRLPITIQPQPDESSCGPTCLHAIYQFWGDQQTLGTVVDRTGRLEHGGTLAVFLACDALRRGFKATIFTYNLTVFDPSWFAASEASRVESDIDGVPGLPSAQLESDRVLPAPAGAMPVSAPLDIAERLRQQQAVKMDYRLQHATTGYLEFLERGGCLRLFDLSENLIREILSRGTPILTGLSSTFLYRSAREYGPDDIPDDVMGSPSGHFVVIAGYDRPQRRVLVMDPYASHPYGKTLEYWISIDRIIGAVLLGIVTHDANLLVIEPSPESLQRASANTQPIKPRRTP
ncbi:C39 family peptidase [soil metagenome]